MFDMAFMVMDEIGNPIFMIPETLPAGPAFLNIVDGGIDIGVGEQILGQIRDMDDATLAMLGLQTQVGMATFEGKPDEQAPDTVQYVASVHETRELK